MPTYKVTIKVDNPEFKNTVNGVYNPPPTVELQAFVPHLSTVNEWIAFAAAVQGTVTVIPTTP